MNVSIFRPLLAGRERGGGGGDDRAAVCDARIVARLREGGPALIGLSIGN